MKYLISIVVLLFIHFDAPVDDVISTDLLYGKWVLEQKTVISEEKEEDKVNSCVGKTNFVILKNATYSYDFYHKENDTCKVHKYTGNWLMNDSNTIRFILPVVTRNVRIADTVDFKRIYFYDSTTFNFDYTINALNSTNLILERNYGTLNIDRTKVINCKEITKWRKQ